MRTHLAVLALLESTCIYASFHAGAYLRFGGDLEAASASMGNLTLRAIVFTVILMLALVSVGLYRAQQSALFVRTLLRLGTALTLAAIGDAVLYYLVPEVSTGRGALALALGVAFLSLTIIRVSFYSITDSGKLRRHVLVYGSGAAAASLTQACARLRHRSFEIVGYLGVLGDDVRTECTPVLPRRSPLLEVVGEHKIDEIVVALDNRRECFPTRELLDCRLAGVRVSETVTFVERETGRIDLESLRPSWLIYGNGFRHGSVHTVVKRVFDVAASLLLLIVGTPTLALATAAILIESKGRGGVFYRQQRIGLHGEPFQILKLRSMVPDAESDGSARWASANDVRVTRVGAIIRRLRIDEIPQIFNILKGEMSFVGPRPERPVFVQELNEQIPFYNERHCVKPGLTGWAQLSYPYGSSVEDARQKLQYDLFYVKNRSSALDLLILLQTLDVVIWGRPQPATSETPPAQEDAAHRAA